MESKTIEERMLEDIGVTKSILGWGKKVLEEGQDPEKVIHKLAGDVLAEKGDYLEALPHYEEFGEVPDGIIRGNQLLYMGLLNEQEYMDIFRNLISKYGRKFSDEDVKNKFVQELQGGHSCFLTGPANRGNGKTLVASIEEETGVKFDRSFIQKAYIEAMKEGYAHCVEAVFTNSNYQRFKPQTEEDRRLVKSLYEGNVTSNSLATPQYVRNLPIITGVSPSYKLLLDVGRAKADMVKRKVLHGGYLKEFIESTGMPCLGKYLYERAGMKREPCRNHIVPLSYTKKPGILERIYSKFKGDK
jgi:hypothetical protein